MTRALAFFLCLIPALVQAQQTSVCLQIPPSPCYLTKYEMTVNIQSPLGKSSLGFRPGTLFQGISDTTAPARSELDSYANPGYLTLTRRNGTPGAPTGTLAGNDLGGFEAWPFGGSAVRGPIARAHALAAEDITSSHWGSKLCLATTPTASTTLSDGFCQQPSGGVTVGSPNGGDKGSGTFNSAGVIYENNVPLDTAAFVPTGSSGHTLPFLDGANQWSGAQTFGEILNSENDQNGASYSLGTSDCGKTVAFSNASTITVTIPAAIVPVAGMLCNVKVRQDGVGVVALNGSASTPAALVSAHSYTKTFGQHAIVELQITTIGGTATAVLTGDGS